jgi:hypothetical protein
MDAESKKAIDMFDEWVYSESLSDREMFTVTDEQKLSLFWNLDKLRKSDQTQR